MFRSSAKVSMVACAPMKSSNVRLRKSVSRKSGSLFSLLALILRDLDVPSDNHAPIGVRPSLIDGEMGLGWWASKKVRSMLVECCLLHTLEKKKTSNHFATHLDEPVLKLSPVR